MGGADLVRHALSLKRLNEEINAIVTWNERVLEEVELLESREIPSYPIAVKDIIDVRGLRVTMGSKVFIDRISSRDAEVVRRIRESGGVVIGMANTHEFASGVTTTSSVFGPTRNPRDKMRIAGGSSGGSAAAVAAGIVPVALGTDTAGSVRIPASLTGVYGIKPTYGAISLDGVFPLAPSLDTVGILAKDLFWLERVFRVVVEYESLTKMRRYQREVHEAKRIKFGVPKWFRASDEVYDKFMSRISSLNYVEIEMPNTEKRILRYFPAVRLSEGSYIHLKYRDKWDLYFPDVRRLVMKGLSISAHEYIEAVNARSEMYREFRSVLKKHGIDALILPTTPVPAPLIEDVIGVEDSSIRDILASINVTYPSFLGLPAISIPSIEISHLPVGIEIFSDRFRDLFLISLARALKEEKIL
ncbi:MAG: amidase [Sulfolobales archaeon]